MVNKGSYLLIEVDRSVAKCDAITETVFTCSSTKLAIQSDILSFGMGVKPWRLQVDAEWGSGRPSLYTRSIVGQCVVLPVGHRAGLQSGICP